jgi:hypothetical protein
MTKQFWFGAMGIGVLAFNLACSEGAPTAPSTLPRNDVGATTSGELASTIAPGSVTFQPDLTANPQTITVPVDSKLLMINRSGRYVRLHSPNCWEFQAIALLDGYSKHTEAFEPAGKTCDYFAWTDNRTRKIFVGRVEVR